MPVPVDAGKIGAQYEAGVLALELPKEGRGETKGNAGHCQETIWATSESARRMIEVVMEQRIGEVAGKVWKVLRKHGEMAISQVPKAVKEREALSYLALGWLAREGKLGFRTKGNKTLVYLTDNE